MTEIEIAIRAGEIGLAAASTLVRLIAEALEHDADEATALRTALATLAARPDLDAVLPRVRVMIARERERVGRADTLPPAPK